MPDIQVDLVFCANKVPCRHTEPGVSRSSVLHPLAHSRWKSFTDHSVVPITREVTGHMNEKSQSDLEWRESAHDHMMIA